MARTVVEDIVDYADNAVMSRIEAAGEYYQKRTGKGAPHLQKRLYGAACALFLSDAAIYLSPAAAVFSFISAMSGFRLWEKLPFGNEIIIGNTTLTKALDGLMYTMGAAIFTRGAYELASGLITGDPSAYSHAARDMLFGAGLFSYKTADYLERSDIGPPALGGPHRNGNGTDSPEDTDAESGDKMSRALYEGDY